jgi:UDP-N-acetylmuramate--alanine ligase
MLAWTLTSLGKDPGYILGGVSRNLVSNAHAGSGKLFVIEADEYDNMFLGLSPSVILLTNVEYDHPDCFPDQESYLSAFEKFINRLKPGGSLVTCADYAVGQRMVTARPNGTSSLTYGFNETADFRGINLKPNEKGGLTFDLVAKDPGSSICVNLQVPGEHNVQNALGVLAVNFLLGNSLEAVTKALEEFEGTGRRFEIVGEARGITIVDDYAHHPTKIRATLSAARLRFPGKRLVAVWQPHTFSRTNALRQEFIESLRLADQVIVTDIYPSREKIEPFDYHALIEEIGSNLALHIADIPTCTDWLTKNLVPGDVLLVLSAGDANLICSAVLNALNERKDDNG